MAQYAVIENGLITEIYDNIPLNWKNVSGFNLLSDTERQNFGFFPITQPTTIYNPIRHNLISNEIELDENDLPFVNQILEDKMSDAEYNTYLVNESLSILRNRRDSYLNASDWTMATDLVDLYGEEWVNNWKTYRQQLRDFTDTYKNKNKPFDAMNIILPSAPH
ncbi:Phage tail assembly chaperone protein [uncultured Caudovirales phage]|uniref:Phage tail assembly chaperone protein n=1 Tax=uncultured Caudovirales phage TaxID=2100421 RepID=A0A6J5LMA9_9CAUD|nr:Phage tail assembly chaperone protein [uncultured Caudovirales phage]